MKYWAYLFTTNPITGKLYRPCGDRSVIRLDGRTTMDSMQNVIEDHNKSIPTPFEAYQIVRGVCLLQAKPLTGIINF